jgi:hypothetical protein
MGFMVTKHDKSSLRYWLWEGTDEAHSLKRLGFGVCSNSRRAEVNRAKDNFQALEPGSGLVGDWENDKVGKFGEGTGCEEFKSINRSTSQ